ncbi:hypothetical protein RB600_008517 [Gaeumannomyces tritici]
MATAIPSIACLGVIGRNNNPLHISLFPSHDPATNTLAPVRTPLQFSLLLSSTLDVFELRARNHAAGGTGLSGDLGLLHAVDERLAAYGFETNTGVRFVIVVDMRGRRVDASVAAALGGATPASSSATGGDAKGGGAAGGVAGGGAAAMGRAAAAVGLREGEMKPVSLLGGNRRSSTGNASGTSSDSSACKHTRSSGQCKRPTLGFCRTLSSSPTSTRPLASRAARRSRAAGLPTT